MDETTLHPRFIPKRIGRVPLMSRIGRHFAGAAIAATLLATSVSAQLIPSVSVPMAVPLPSPIGSVPVAGPVIQNVLGQPQAQQAIRPTLDTVTGIPESLAESGAPTLLELRRLRLEQLIRDNRSQLEEGERGQPVRRGIVLAVDPDPLSLQQTARAGFRMIADETNPALGMRVVQLAAPNGMSARSALKLARRAAPRLQADYDPIFEPAGGALMPVAGALAASAGAARGRVVGMIDGGVASHPSLAGAAIEQNGFAGNPQPTGHGTAVASLLVGNQGPFRGAATGAKLYVADVYGGNRAAGSATAIVRALGWLASKRPKVINISLVGPANAGVETAIRILQSRGIQVVAAVGNDGPAAPPQYPASYSGVIAVTGVDARGRALAEAGKASHLDFAAPGADMAAALPGQGYSRVRGTSFAAPLASARLLLAGSPARLAAEARPGKGRIGRGIVCGDCRIDPRTVGAR
jgi:hypothetical protein